MKKSLISVFGIAIVFGILLSYPISVASGAMIFMSEEFVMTDLAKGNLVIIPVNGQKLGNPRFEPPGPIVHMILVHGYDFARSEFIVHDPGTQFGKDYRYSFDVITDAFEDYPSGEEVTVGSGTRAMIVISHSDDTISPW